MSKLETNTIDTVSGTSTLQVGSTNTTTITLGASGDTINIPSGATIANSGTATGFGEAMTPAFHAYNSADQNISASTLTQVIFNTEIYDTDSAFASNQFTVPSGKAGKYFVYFRLGFASGTDFTFQVTVQINSSFNADSGFRVNGENQYYNNHFSGQVLDLAAGDVVRVMIYQGDGTHNISGTENRANFGAYRIIT